MSAATPRERILRFGKLMKERLAELAQAEAKMPSSPSYLSPEPATPSSWDQSAPSSPNQTDSVCSVNLDLLLQDPSWRL